MQSAKTNKFSKFKKWLATPLGAHLLTLETAIHKINLKKIFKKNVLILGDFKFVGCLSLNENITPIVLNQNVKAQKNSSITNILAQEDKLPIDTESIDLLYLPHTLTFSQNPHEVLREAYRVLKPEGHLIITTFNWFSIMGLVKIVCQILDNPPWFGTFYTSTKLTDWLILLGFDIFKTNSFFYNFPINNKKYLKKTKFIDKLFKLNLPFGGATCIIAKKRIETITPIMPKWKTKESIITTKDLTEPTCFDNVKK